MNILSLPPYSLLPGRNEKIPFVMVADEAFGLSEKIMKPYSGSHQVANYRLAGSWSVMENAWMSK